MKYTGNALQMREQIIEKMSGPQTAGRWNHNRTEFNGDALVEVAAAILAWAGPRWRGAWQVSSHGSITINISMSERHRLRVTITRNAQVSAAEFRSPDPRHPNQNYRERAFGRHSNWGWANGEATPKPREYTAFIESFLNQANAQVTDAQATAYHLIHAQRELKVADEWVERARRELEFATERRTGWQAEVDELAETLNQQKAAAEGVA